MTLAGTEKQINWATEIREAFLARLWAEVADANERVKSGDLPPVWAQAVYDAVNTLTASVDRDARGQAKLWIEHRDRIMGFAARIKELAERSCPRHIYAGPALAEWRLELGLPKIA